MQARIWKVREERGWCFSFLFRPHFGAPYGKHSWHFYNSLKPHVNHLFYWKSSWFFGSRLYVNGSSVDSSLPWVRIKMTLLKPLDPYMSLIPPFTTTDSVPVCYPDLCFLFISDILRFPFICFKFHYFISQRKVTFS